MTLSVLIVILVTAMSIDDKTRWPWSTTLIPVLGTAVLLVFLTPGTLTYQMLSVRPLVRVGLWSYSTYLWHYPIFSLVRYSTDSYSPILLVSLSLFLGWLSWRFIETPFRDRQKFNRRTILSVAAVSCVLLSSTGLIAGGLTTKGATANLSDKAGAPLPVMLIGDSHADHLLSGLSVTLGNQLSARTSPGCVPLWNVDRYDYRFKRGDCAKFATAAINEAVRSPAVRTVVLASMGPVYLTGTTFHGFDPDRVTDDGLVLVSEPEIADRWRVFETGLRNTFHRLERAGKKTIFVIDVPELGIEPQRCDLDNPRSCQNPVAEVDRRSLRYRELVKEVAKEFASVSVFEPTQLFCNNTRCTGIRKGERLYRDVDHLSDAGSALVAEFLTPIIFDSIGNRDES